MHCLTLILVMLPTHLVKPEKLFQHQHGFHQKDNKIDAWMANTKGTERKPIKAISKTRELCELFTQNGRISCEWFIHEPLKLNRVRINSIKLKFWAKRKSSPLPSSVSSLPPPHQHCHHHRHMHVREYKCWDFNIQNDSAWPRLGKPHPLWHLIPIPWHPVFLRQTPAKVNQAIDCYRQYPYRHTPFQWKIYWVVNFSWILFILMLV